MSPTTPPFTTPIVQSDSVRWSGTSWTKCFENTTLVVIYILAFVRLTIALFLVSQTLSFSRTAHWLIIGLNINWLFAVLWVCCLLHLQPKAHFGTQEYGTHISYGGRVYLWVGWHWSHALFDLLDER